MKILITGGAGFLGHHLVEHVLKNTDWEIVVLDSLNYSTGGFDKLRDIKVFDEKRVQVLTADIRFPISPGIAKEIGTVNYIAHLAAETHVDNSIKSPGIFVETNVVGTFNLLEYARSLEGLEKFAYFSTDEVFGPAFAYSYAEWDRYNSTNPYSATKAAGEELCLAWANTYKLPVLITHCMNLFGERQHVEKFIPGTIRKILQGDTVLIHSYPDKQRSGSRFYLHARTASDALLFLLDTPGSGNRDKYNITGQRELGNLTLARMIADLLDSQLRFEMVDFHSSRPGHDLRYALDGRKLECMGWKSPISFEDSLEKTVKWYKSNPRWLQ